MLPLFRLPQTYRNIQRFQQIIQVLVKHGFGQIVEQLNLQNLVSLGKRALSLKWSKETEEKFTLAQRLRMVFEELGPTYIKFGQILSSRPDLIPQEMILELKKLQENVPPFPYEEVVKQIETEFETPINELFATIEPHCKASASIAQVHNAKLLDGKEVVVKVQRPGIENIIDRDLKILHYFAFLIEKYIPESKRYKPTGLMDEFAKTIRRECDFIIEASNTERMRQNFEGDENICIPEVYWHLTSKRVLTLERIEGININDIEEIDKKGFDRKKLARQGAEIIFKMVFDFGFFHADPHPGNLFVLDDGRIALVDFGIVGHLERENTESLANIGIALITRDYNKLVREFLNLGVLSDDTDFRVLRRDLMELIEPYYGMPLKNISFGDVMQKIFALSFKHKTTLPPDMLLLAKSLVLIEGIGRQLDPELDLVEIGTPFAKKLISRRLSPGKVAFDTMRLVSESGELIKVLPDQVRLLLRKILRNELKLEVMHENLQFLYRELDRLGTKASLGIIISALIISGAILIASIGSTSKLITTLGAFNFLSALVLALWLLLSIFRGGRY